ncbi:MAG: HAMP domain-containing histidine kinase [Sandaracinaceae bacterium]|nr:HAMP domain-containing histidine kinase [Sandaracinaceae bacterium]
MTGTGQSDEIPKLSVKPLVAPSMWLMDTVGREALEQACRTVDVSPDVLLQGTEWLELARVGAYLAEVRRHAPSELEFREACVYRMREGYGPVLLVLPVATPLLMFRAMARTVHLFSNVSRCEVVAESRTHAVLRYESDAPELETRELCMTRSAAASALPTLFGLPEAILRERACIAHGDPVCEYEFRFYTRSRWLPAVGGALVGGATAYGLSLAGIDPSLGWASLPLAFGLLGLVFEMRKTSQANVAHGLAIQGALEELARREGEARREIVAFHGRQREWGRLLEEQVTERTTQLELLLERLRELGQARVTSVRGVWHDLRSPLQVMLANQGIVRRAFDTGSEKLLDAALADDRESIAKMEELLRQLVESARADRGLVPFNPVEMDVGPWVETLRNRVKALVHGRDVSVSVFQRREAPERIVTDRLIFDRVADNLCSNAARYTERGSIVVELDGKPGFLTLKVSDTGFGISQDRIEQIFQPGNRPDPRAPRSVGVGLSVVVQLMAQVGGRLEVMSKLGQGTTFWAHFPVQPPAAPSPREGSPPKLADVVTIRKPLSA